MSFVDGSGRLLLEYFQNNLAAAGTNVNAVGAQKGGQRDASQSADHVKRGDDGKPLQEAQIQLSASWARVLVVCKLGDTPETAGVPAEPAGHGVLSPDQLDDRSDFLE